MQSKNNSIIIIVLFTFIYINAHAKFNNKAFLNDTETAEWLCEYDFIAWQTAKQVILNDSNKLKRIGDEWFCFQDINGNWHAIYGKYNNDIYDQVLHYKNDENSLPSLTDELLDTAIANKYARALLTANKQIQFIKDSTTIHFNQYIRQNEDETFTVWIFPAYQPTYIAIYGGEFIYRIDASGNKLLEDLSYFQNRFRGYKVGDPEQKEIFLDYTELKDPTLGGIFFVWYYKTHYDAITLVTKFYTSTVLKNVDGYYWSHEKRKKK